MLEDEPRVIVADPSRSTGRSQERMVVLLWTQVRLQDGQEGSGRGEESPAAVVVGGVITVSVELRESGDGVGGVRAAMPPVIR
jgi:hypothetical protein